MLDASGFSRPARKSSRARVSLRSTTTPGQKDSQSPYFSSLLNSRRSDSMSPMGRLLRHTLAGLTLVQIRAKHTVGKRTTETAPPA